MRASDPDKYLSIDLGTRGGSGPVGLALLLFFPGCALCHRGAAPAECLSHPPVSACHLGLDDGRRCQEIKDRRKEKPEDFLLLPSLLWQHLCNTISCQRSLPRAQLFPRNFGHRAVVTLPFLCGLLLFFSLW